MTSNEYNVSGVKGGIASAQNARAYAHLAIGLGGNSPAFNVASRIFQKFAKIQGDVSTAHPVIWKLEKKHIQIRQLIIAKLGTTGYLEAIAHGLDEIHIVGVYASPQ